MKCRTFGTFWFRHLSRHNKRGAALCSAPLTGQPRRCAWSEAGWGPRTVRTGVLCLCRGAVFQNYSWWIIHDSPNEIILIKAL